MDKAVMNKVATKEPSMDEILSSIRQIIADDDAAAARPDLAVVAGSATFDDEELADMSGPNPLPLSREQIVRDPPAPSSAPFGHQTYVDDEGEDENAGLRADFIDPDDVTFDVEKTDTPAVAVQPALATSAVSTRLPGSVAPEPSRLRPSPAQAAPMPDSTLSADIAEELLEPATNAAVRSNFARLSNLGVGAPGLTIEAMMRDMLRPMLKEWLDEHLPTLVERVVEKEIARISRGVE